MEASFSLAICQTVNTHREGNALSYYTVWFEIVARTIAIDVHDHGGALKVKKDEYRQVLISLEPELADCPEIVWEHYRRAFTKYRLKVCCFEPGGMHDRTLLIYADTFDEEQARQIVANHEAMSFDKSALST